MTNRQISILAIVVAITLALIGWIINIKTDKPSANNGSQSIGTLKVDGNNNQNFNTDNSYKSFGTTDTKVNIVNIGNLNIYNYSPIDEKTVQAAIKKELATLVLPEHPTLSPVPISVPPATQPTIGQPLTFKPDIEVINFGVKVTITYYTDTPERPSNLVKALFEIPFMNNGNLDAKNLKVKWDILDNGARITAPDEYFKENPIIIADIPSGRGIILSYRPDIGVAGEGIIKLTLNYDYINPSTGEKIPKQYKGSVNYKIEEKDTPHIFFFSKLSN